LAHVKKKSSDFPTIHVILIGARSFSMPTGPRGEKRPTDAIGCAIMVGQLATGKITEILKDPSGPLRKGWLEGTR
jgi:hypothetical protein